jgi:hypothetical protein
MPKMTPFLMRAFKGLNQGARPQDIEDNQFQELENFYPWNNALYMRSGLTPITNVAHTEELTSLASYKPSDGDWTILVGGLTKIGQLDGQGISVIQRVEGGAYASSDLPWSIKQYNDIGYLCRDLAGTVQRTDGLAVGDAGVPPPASAPTLAAAASGVMDAGNYYVVCTFFNNVTEAESNASPVSAVVTLGANGKITVTDIPISSNYQVNSRRLYVTVVGQQGQYFLALTINDNFTTTATINITQANLGRAVDVNNGLPPGGAKYIEIFNERMWVTDGVDIYFSEDGLPESFGPFSVISVGKNDGFTVNGLKSFNERLLIGKSRGIYYITGFDEQTFQLRQLSERHGVMSHHSMAVSENLCFWFGGDNFYITDGTTVKAVGDVHIRTLLDSVQEEDYKKITSAVDATRGWYIASLPTASGRVIAVYDYRNNNWTTFTYHASVGGPRAFGDFVDTDNKPVIYCIADVINTKISNFNDGNDDLGFDITFHFRTKSFGFDSDDTLKCLKEMQVLYSSTAVAEDLQFTLRRDDQSSAITSVTLGTFGGYMWKRVSLSNLADPGTFLDVALSYIGNSVFVISGIGLKVIFLDRKVAAL